MKNDWRKRNEGKKNHFIIKSIETFPFKMQNMERKKNKKSNERKMKRKKEIKIQFYKYLLYKAHGLSFYLHFVPNVPFKFIWFIRIRPQSISIHNRFVKTKKSPLFLFNITIELLCHLNSWEEEKKIPIFGAEKKSHTNWLHFSIWLINLRNGKKKHFCS